MDIRILTSSEDFRRYGDWVRSHPQGSLWQSLEWKIYQEGLGRDVRIYVAEEDGKIVVSALVVIDRTSFGLSTWEVPRGPLWNMEYGMVNIESFLRHISQDAKRTRCISLFFSPAHSIPHSIFNIQYSRRLVMPEATRILDLTLSEDDLLAQMKPKGRYNIRLAEKHGVRVTLSKDVAAFSQLMEETMQRDGFRSSGGRTYRRFLELLPRSFLLLAYPPVTPSGDADVSARPAGERIEGPIAGLLGMIWGSGGVYYYGASSHAQKELMAPYLLQWEAIKHCKAQGCSSYDLFGITPPSPTIPQSSPDHPWSGVSDFKAKFGGTVVPYPAEQEITLRPLTKTLLKIKRKIMG